MNTSKNVAAWTDGGAGSLDVAVMCARVDLVRLAVKFTRKELTIAALHLAEDGPYTVDALAEALEAEAAIADAAF